MSGFLVLKPGVGSSSRAAKSVKRYFSLLPDFVLYTFRTESDERALTATPLPGYTVLTGAQLKGDASVPEKEREKTIKMFVQPQQASATQQPAASDSQFKKVYYFAGTTPEEVERYIHMPLLLLLRLLSPFGLLCPSATFVCLRSSCVCGFCCRYVAFLIAPCVHTTRTKHYVFVNCTYPYPCDNLCFYA